MTKDSNPDPLPKEVVVKPASNDIADYFSKLQAKCGTILIESTAGQNGNLMGASRLFGAELGVWKDTLINRREAELIKVALYEYEFALLALAQGHYRHAYKALRLVLELCLQSVLLSANEMVLREWLANKSDTFWSVIVDLENGVFSKRYTQAFFPDLESHVAHFRALAVSVYRECSECVHGNVPKHVLLPSSLSFDSGVFSLWHSKAATVARIAHFAFCLRYLNDLNDAELSNLEPFLSDRIGYLAGIRSKIGGPTQQ